MAPTERTYGEEPCIAKYEVVNNAIEQTHERSRRTEAYSKSIHLTRVGGVDRSATLAIDIALSGSALLDRERKLL